MSNIIADELAGILLGPLLSSILFGISLYQAFAYFTKHGVADRPILKIWVVLTCIFNASHVFVAYDLAYYYVVTSQVMLYPLSRQIWSGYLLALFGSPHVFLVQSFFAYRAYAISDKKIWIPMVIILLSVVQVGACIGDVVQSYLTGNTRIPDIVGFGADIVVNALIAATTIYHLRAMKTYFSNAERFIEKLINLTLRSCLLIAILNLTSLFLLVFSTRSTYFSITYHIELRLYANSMLSQLNSREELRDPPMKPNNSVLLDTVVDPHYHL